MDPYLGGGASGHGPGGVPRPALAGGQSVWRQAQATLRPRPRGCHLVTEEVMKAMPGVIDLAIGTVHVFLMHTSASLALGENADADVRTDLAMGLDRIVPESFPYRHTVEGPDDMPAHIKNALVGSSLTVPVTKGRLALGTWQGFYLLEHRDHAEGRTIVLTVHGQAK